MPDPITILVVGAVISAKIAVSTIAVVAPLKIALKIFEMKSRNVGNGQFTERAQELLDELEDPREEDEIIADALKYPDYTPSGMTDPTKVNRVSATIAIKCRNALNIQDKTKANVLVARKWIIDFLDKKEGLRTVHKARILPLALALVFIPTKFEVQCEQLLNCPEMVVRAEDKKKRWWSWNWNSFKGLFGAVAVEPPVPSV